MEQSLPLNITLSIGNVSFHLSPSTDHDAHNDETPRRTSSSSTNVHESPRSAARRRRGLRMRQMRGGVENGPPNSDQQPPMLSIRREKSQQQPAGASFAGANINNTEGSTFSSPVRRHIVGRVKAMKEKIEVEEKRKPGSFYGAAAGDPSPIPRNQGAGVQLSGYCIDLNCFTGTLQIMPNINPEEALENTGESYYNAGSSDYTTKSSSGYDLQRKRVVDKNYRRDESMKRSKTKNFTWIASNDGEVEIGMDKEKSPSNQNQVQNFLGDGIASRKKFDFVDVSDSESERKEGDGGATSPWEHGQFLLGAANITSRDPVRERSSTIESYVTATSSISHNINQLQDSDRQSEYIPPLPPMPQSVHSDKSEKLVERGSTSFSTPPPPESVQHGSDAKQVEKGKMSFSTPPKVLHYAHQAMKNLGLAGKDESFNVPRSDPVITAAAGSSLRSCDAVAGKHGYNDEGGTELHHACASSDLELIYNVLEITTPADAMIPDSAEKLPIHLFAENTDLITENPDECEAIVFRFVQIMGPENVVQALYPSSGWGPFVGIIGRWVDQVHEEISHHSGTVATNTLKSAGESQTRIRTTFTQQLPLFRAADRNNGRVLMESLFMKDREKAFFLPYSVVITDHVKWAIRMLSNLLDVYPEQTREAILTNITSMVPLFLKSVLLLNDVDEMNLLTETSLVKHVAIDKRSINVWLIAMLTSPTREIQTRAVSYLKLLSRLTLTDLVATSQYRDKFSDAEVKRFVTLRKETFDALYSMPGIFPAVLGLGGGRIEALSTTRVMRYITDRTIRKEKRFFRLICDFFYCAFLLMGFRLQIEFVFDTGHRDGPEGYREHNLWSKSTWAIAFYFLVKDFLSLLSLYMTSTKLATRYCSSVFNIIDMTAVIIIVAEGGPLNNDSINTSEGWYAGVVSILLWLKLMGAFKILNSNFALFLYAVWEVIKEIKWFIVFLFMVTVMFSDAVRAAVAVTGDCASEEYAHTDFCDGGFATIFRMYSFLVSDVDMEYFGSSNVMIALYFFFSMFCIVILLNILIAIIIDSYERTKQRSKQIFGRAQIEYAAALVARNQFIRPKNISEFHVASFVPHALRKFLRLMYVFAFTGALTLFEFGFTGAITYYMRPDSADSFVTYTLIMVYIIVGSIFNTYIVSFSLIVVFNWCEHINSAFGSMFYVPKRCLELAVNVFHRVLGFDSDRKQLDLSEEVIEH